jgi:hypothetical protein
VTSGPTPKFVTVRNRVQSTRCANFGFGARVESIVDQLPCARTGGLPGLPGSFQPFCCASIWRR